MTHTYYDIKDISPEISESLSVIDNLKQRIDEEKQINKALWAAVQEKLRVEWTYDSNAIEGSSLTKGETLFFLKEGLTVEGKPFKDFLDARNHAEAIDYLYDVIKNQRPITPGLIKELNALLLSGVNYTPAVNEYGQKIQKPATPGQFKAQPNHVLKTDGTIHFYSDLVHVAAEVDTLCQWIMDHIDTIHPLVSSAVAHYNMVRIHPFDDGNGRGARILMNLILLRKGYPVAVVRNEHRRVYLSALNQADNGNFHPFLSFIARSLIDTENIILTELTSHKTSHKR